MKLLLIFLLGCLSAAYFARGFYFLLFVPNHSDLSSRYAELKSLTDHILPYSGYPLYSYPIQFFLIPPFLPWGIASLYFAFLNVLAMAFIGAYFLNTYAALKKADILLLITSCAAIGGFSTALGVGQYTLILLSFLVAALWALEQKRQLIAGLFLGLAMMKPHLAIFFLLPFVAKKRYDSIAVAVGLVFLLSLIMWASIHQNPFVHFFSIIQHSPDWVCRDTSYGIYQLLKPLNIPCWQLMGLLGMISGIVFFYLAFAIRMKLIESFAAASVLVFLSQYNREYNNPLAMFLIMAVFLRAIAAKKIFHWLNFLLIALPFWLPSRILVTSFFQAYKVLSLTWGLVFLMLSNKKEAKKSREEVHG